MEKDLIIKRIVLKDSINIINNITRNEFNPVFNTIKPLFSTPLYGLIPLLLITVIFSYMIVYIIKRRMHSAIRT